MRPVGIKVLKNKLSHYVKLAAAGETVLVTDRDKVVAELVAPTPGRAEALEDARLAEAVRAGWIRPSSGPRGVVPPRYPRMPLSDLLEAIEADRADRV
jgi:antitoxin (DNA-binding transcriptional repressor) of toxin-antitoxin stability system